MMKKKQLVCAVLAAVMAVNVTACSGGADQETTPAVTQTEPATTVPETTEEPATETEEETTQAPKELHVMGEGYTPSVPGAESELELYQKMMAFLKSEEMDAKQLDDMTDKVMILAYLSKKNDGGPNKEIASTYQYNITRGMSFCDTCNLIAEYKKAITEMDPVLVEDGWYYQFTPEQFNTLYEMFPKEYLSFHEDMTEEQFKEALLSYLAVYMAFMEMDTLLDVDGSAIVWEEKSKLKAYELTKYYKKCPDLEENFPRAYHMEITKANIDGRLVSVDVEYTEVDGRFYFLNETWYYDVYE